MAKASPLLKTDHGPHLTQCSRLPEALRPVPAAPPAPSAVTQSHSGLRSLCCLPPSPPPTLHSCLSDPWALLFLAASQGDTLSTYWNRNSCCPKGIQRQIQRDKNLTWSSCQGRGGGNPPESSLSARQVTITPCTVKHFDGTQMAPLGASLKF